MKKEKAKDGLTISNHVAVTLRKEKRVVGTNVMELLIVGMGLFGSMSAFISSFELEPDIRRLILILVFGTLIYYGISLLKKGKSYLFFSFFLVQGLIIKKEWYYVQNGFYYLENAIIIKAEEYYNRGMVQFMASGSRKVALAAFLAVIGMAVSFVFVMVVRFQVLRGVFYVSMAILTGAGFIVGVIPNPVSLICVFLTAYLLKVTDMVPSGERRLYEGEEQKKQQIRNGYKQRIRGNGALFLLGMFFVLMIVTYLLFPRDKYLVMEPSIMEKKEVVQKVLKDTFSEDGINSVRKAIEQINWSDLSLFRNVEKTSGGVGGGKLGATATIEYTNETALAVTLPQQSNTVYLKGYVGVHYNTDEWESLTKEERNQYKSLVADYGGEFNGQNIPGAVFDRVEENLAVSENSEVLDEIDFETVIFTRYPITIEYRNASSSYLYLPYLFDYQNGFLREEVDDLYSSPARKQDAYQMDYRQVMIDRLQSVNLYVGSEWIERYNQFETEYEQYVNQVYLEVPETGLSKLRQVDLGVPYAGNIQEEFMVIDAVKQYLADNTTYTLSPGKLSDGQDFVENFLFVKKKGYCVHYASAATLLLRLYGVPARYVEGYVVTKSDILNGEDAGLSTGEAYLLDGTMEKGEMAVKTVNVTDRSAHAWVEVYLEGYGWIPVEVTVGYMEQEKEEAVLTPSVTPTPEEDAKATTVPKPTDAPEVTKEQQKEEGNESPMINNQENTTGIQKNEKSNRVFLFCLIFLILLLVFIFVIMVRMQFIKKKREKLLSGHSNEAVLLLYSMMSGMFTLMKITLPEEMINEEFVKQMREEGKEIPDGLDQVMALVLKARFSNEELREEEYQKVYVYYQLLRERFYANASSITKIYAFSWKVL